MRLKEDDSSWRAGGIKKRDFRHDPHAAPEELPKGKNKKNGRQAPPRGWCKGIKGNEHEPYETSMAAHSHMIWWSIRCKKCNKWIGYERKAA